MTHAEAQYQKFREWRDKQPEWPPSWKSSMGHVVRLENLKGGPPTALLVSFPSCSLTLTDARKLGHWLLRQTGPCDLYAYRPEISPSGTITGVDGREHMAGHN